MKQLTFLGSTEMIFDSNMQFSSGISKYLLSYTKRRFEHDRNNCNLITVIKKRIS